MKFAQIIGLYTVTLALTLTSSQAWLHKEIFKKDADAETTTVADADAGEHAFEGTPGLCNDYWMLSRDLRDCMSVGCPDNPNSYFARDELTNMCLNKDNIKECMLEKIEGCETNYDTIKGMLDTTFDYCNGYEVPQDVLTFLNEGNVTVADSCMDAIFNFDNMTSQQCNRSTEPGCSDAVTLDGILADTNEAYWWYINCMISNDLHEVAAGACDDVTRGQAYGIVISSLPLYCSFGINQYSKFEVFKLAYDGLGLF